MESQTVSMSSFSFLKRVFSDELVSSEESSFTRTHFDVDDL